MSNPLVIIASARAKAGFEDQMIKAQKALVPIARARPGCLRYELNLSANEKGLVTFVEQWESKEAWYAHMSSPELDAFRRTSGRYIGEFELQEMHQIA